MRDMLRAMGLDSDSDCDSDSDPDINLSESDVETSDVETSGVETSDDEYLPSEDEDTDDVDDETAPLLGAFLPLAISGFQAPWVATGTAWSGPGVYPHAYGSFHCPPATPQQLEGWNAEVFDQRCNCVNSQLGGQCICTQLFRDLLASELTAAGIRTNCRERAPNNEQRKRCYREVAKCLYEDLYGKRRRLPHCIVARIRAIWPSETGLYMGFKLK